MGTYAISFSISYDTSKGYDERYDSLMDAINKCKTVWAETTSLCLVETDETLEVLERRLWLSKFDSSKDKLLVMDVGYDKAIARGAISQKEKLRKLLYGIDIK